MLPDMMIDNRYRIIKSIGQGGMSNVYLAHDEYLDREVSLKILRLDLQNDHDAILRFEREASAAAELVHPNIIQIYDAGEFDGSQYLVLEYVEGMDLKEYIHEHFPIPYQQVVDIMEQVLNAAQAAHEMGIIHRDLKPKNILIDANQQVKITDFGIAVSSDEGFIQDSKQVLGSVHYLSPEQIAGEEASVKSDIYALGVMLYELLIGKVPYEGENPESIALKHMQESVPYPRDADPRIPQSLENVVLRATAKNVIDRYISVQEMADDLKTTLSPRRSEEKRFVPLMTPLIQQQTEDQTRIIPLEQLHDQLQTGIATDSDESANEQANQQIVALNEQGYNVSDIASQVNRSQQYVRDYLSKSDKTATEPLDGISQKIVNLGREGYYLEDIAKEVDRPVRFVQDLLNQQGLSVYKKQPKKRRWPLFLITGLLLIIAGLLAYKVIAPNQVTVPDLSKASQKSAIAKLKELGFQVGNTVEQSSKTVKAGQVIETDPPKGTKLQKGDVVKLVVSTGQEMVSFGYYIGQDYNTVANQLTSKGFTVQKKEVYSPSATSGSIIDQNINVQEQVIPGDTTVIFTVSKGQEQVKVPNFVNGSLADVQNWGTNHNININLNYQNSDEASDTVLEQSLSAGSMITPGDNAGLTVMVSRGPDMVDVNNFAGQTVSYAKQWGDANGVIINANGAKDDAIIESQDKTGKVKKGSTVTVTVKVTSDNSSSKKN